MIKTKETFTQDNNTIMGVDTMKQNNKQANHL